MAKERRTARPQPAERAAGEGRRHNTRGPAPARHRARGGRALLLGALALLAGCGAGGPEGGGGSDPRPAEPTASVRPQRAAPGDGVEVSASGFAPHAQLEIGFGPPNSEYEVVTTARADAGGAVEASVRVPSRARPGRSYVWVVAEVDNRPKAVTGEFTVLQRDPGRDAAGSRLSGSASSWP